MISCDSNARTKRYGRLSLLDMAFLSSAYPLFSLHEWISFKE